MTTETQHVRRIATLHTYLLARDAAPTVRTRPSWFTLTALAVIVSMLLCLLAAEAGPVLGL